MKGFLGNGQYVLQNKLTQAFDRETVGTERLQTLFAKKRLMQGSERTLRLSEPLSGSQRTLALSSAQAQRPMHNVVRRSYTQGIAVENEQA